VPTTMMERDGLVESKGNDNTRKAHVHLRFVNHSPLGFEKLIMRFPGVQIGRQAGGGMRVLLIEDDTVTAQAIELVLRSQDFDVYRTDRGSEGIYLEKHHEHDIIVLDLNLPDVPGCEVLRTLRADRLRRLRPETVDELAESISKQRLLHPIILYRRPSDGALVLAAGWHRFEAVRKLGHDKIAAVILDGLDADQAQLVEIDENLIRADLGPAERAGHTARRKELYERLHPETKKGATGRGRKKSQVETSKAPVPAFIDDAARKTGRSRATVAREVARGILADVMGTSLDKGDQLDALAKLPPGQQRYLVDRAKAGDKINVKAEAKKHRRAERERELGQKQLAANTIVSGGEKPPRVTIILKTYDGKDVPYQMPQGKTKFNEQTNEDIGWARFSWNPVTGCLRECQRYCYAKEIADKFKDTYPVGFTPLFHHERLNDPANTKVPEKAKEDPRYGRVFVCSMADLYGKWVKDEWIEQVHASANANPQWEYLFLTKSPRRYLGLQFPSTAWIGTSIDEQWRVQEAEEAFRELRAKNVGRLRWASFEPLLEPIKIDLSLFDWMAASDQPRRPLSRHRSESRCGVDRVLHREGPGRPRLPLLQDAR
jgi:protein gp37/ParB-like chromosome segregation protein Spo0J